MVAAAIKVSGKEQLNFNNGMVTVSQIADVSTFITFCLASSSASLTVAAHMCGEINEAGQENGRRRIRYWLTFYVGVVVMERDIWKVEVTKNQRVSFARAY